MDADALDWTHWTHRTLDAGRWSLDWTLDETLDWTLDDWALDWTLDYWTLDRTLDHDWTLDAGVQDELDAGL